KLGPFVRSGLFSWPGKLRMALDLVLPRSVSDDESLGAFVRRRLGREALERVAQPLVAGIYTADPDDLSLAATMPRFSELDRLVRYIDPALATLLGEIPYASSATVTFGFRRAEVPHPLDGFGFVVPRTERRAVLACTFSSVKYPGRAPEGHALLRCFVGGALNEHVLESDDPALVAGARDELRQALGITAEPVLTRVARFTKAMPQSHVGHA